MFGPESTKTGQTLLLIPLDELIFCKMLSAELLISTKPAPLFQIADPCSASKLFSKVSDTPKSTLLR